MHEGASNLMYLARGMRNYGLRPVLARPRRVWEFQWIWSGGARPERSGAEIYVGKSPCLYLSHPDSPHGWTDEGAGRSEVFVLHFRSVPEELVAMVKPAETLVVEFGDGERRQFAARLEEAWEMSRLGDARLGMKLAQVLVETTLLVLGRGAPSLARGPLASRVEHGLHWFEENLAENPTVGEVAKAVGVSAAHLRRLFAEAGRGSPREELARIRVAAAQRCLREGWKLERVAAYLGFSEASAFSRAFTAVCGKSPRKWLADDGAGKS